MGVEVSLHLCCMTIASIVGVSAYSRPGNNDRVSADSWDAWQIETFDNLLAAQALLTYPLSTFVLADLFDIPCVHVWSGLFDVPVIHYAGMSDIPSVHFWSGFFQTCHTHFDTRTWKLS